MSTDYKLAADLFATESSTNVAIGIDNYEGYMVSQYMDEHQLRAAIVKLVEVLSYVSDDPEEVLRRFNVNYGDEK
jgi:hypothetical protein